VLQLAAEMTARVVVGVVHRSMILSMAAVVYLGGVLSILVYEQPGGNAFVSPVHYELPHELVYLSHAAGWYSLQVFRSERSRSLRDSDLYDPSREELEIGDVFGDSEPNAIGFCKVLDCVVPQAPPGIESLQQLFRLLGKTHCDVRVENDLLEG